MTKPTPKLMVELPVYDTGAELEPKRRVARHPLRDVIDAVNDMPGMLSYGPTRGGDYTEAEWAIIFRHAVAMALLEENAPRNKTAVVDLLKRAAKSARGREPGTGTVNADAEIIWELIENWRKSTP